MALGWQPAKGMLLKDCKLPAGWAEDWRRMQSKTTRIAYLKRMLERLEGEEARLNNMVTAGELTGEGAKLGASSSGAS